MLFTAGLDGLLKAASSETGQVRSKALYLPESDAASALVSLSPDHLLLGTDAGNIHLYDIRDPAGFASPKPSASWKGVHTDYISSLLPLAASGTSVTGFSRQFIATGDTTLSHLDVRKPGSVLGRSDDQEDELLCSAYIPNAPSRQTGGSQKILTGTAAGVVTTWNKGFWEDHQDRIPLSRSTGDPIESLLQIPEGFEIHGWSGRGTLFAAGSGDGKVRIVKMGPNKTLATLAHSYSADEAKRMANGKVKTGDYEEGMEEGVSSLDMDCDGNLVTGGGMIVKIWTAMEAAGGKDDSDADSDADSDDEDSRKRPQEDSEMDSDEESDDEKEDKKKKRKKRKGGIGKAKSVGVKNVASFSGLD